jgi:hypothetical protein
LPRNRISRTEQKNTDYQAAVNRQYLAGHSDTEAERVNAITALYTQGIAIDGYPIDWPGDLKWMAAYDGDLPIGLRSQPFMDYWTREHVFTVVELERGGRAVVHDHRRDDDTTVAAEGGFADAVRVADQMIADEATQRRGRRR